MDKKSWILRLEGEVYSKLTINKMGRGKMQRN